MKIFSPKNIFALILLESLPKDTGIEIEYVEAALACKKLEEETSAVALMPTLDLINHQTLFISSKFGISFDGVLSNSFLHFQKEKRSLDKIFLRGDVTLNEIILSKILFSERYATEIQINLETSSLPTGDKHYIVVGNENFLNWKCEEGISFADEIADLLDFPYVNFVFASQDKESVSALNKIFEQTERNIDQQAEKILSQIKFPETTLLYIKQNLDSVFFDLTKNEVEAINELIKLIYYRGITDDMFEVKFA